MAVTERVLIEAHNRAGVHSTATLPTDTSQRTMFGLLEILDWDCVDYDDFDIDNVTADEIREYLIEHRDAVLSVPIPSYLGLLTNRFQFLVEEVRKD